MLLAWQKNEANKVAERVYERRNLTGHRATRRRPVLGPPFAPVPCLVEPDVCGVYEGVLEIGIAR